MRLELFIESYLSWHLIKGIRTWKGEGEKKIEPTGKASGRIPSSYQKHPSSKQLNFHTLKVCGGCPGLVSR